MLSALRYSSDPAGLTGESSMLAFFDDGQFQVADETDTGRRIVVDNSSRIILNNVTVEDSGFYQCRIDYRSGKEVEKNVHLRIGVAPTIEPFSDMEVLEETSFKVVCHTQGLPSPNVNWVHTSAGLVSTSRILVVKSIEVSQNGAYRCNATNHMGTAEQSLQIKVFRKPSVREFYHVGTLNGVVWQCEDVKLICEMAPNHSLRVRNYRLYQNDRLITEQRDSGVFSISRVALNRDGIYACVPETRLGLGRNKTLRLRVKAAPKLCNDISTSSFNFSSNTSSTAKPVSLAQPKEAGRSGFAKGNAGLNASFILILSWLFLSLIV
ncbi:fasciclin-2 isoform X1 [Paramuricea clavata]|uniref:Fasciclin-2 isoform X1 n=1 Tax=Paramuricea clavata TaxID=317549 RepID=A0A6S7II05_PARCT|nr:fasciclin-2 isoform X1 [Paramuricea clavata]